MALVSISPLFKGPFSEYTHVLNCWESDTYHMILRVTVLPSQLGSIDLYSGRLKHPTGATGVVPDRHLLYTTSSPLLASLTEGPQRALPRRVPRGVRGPGS